MKRASFTHVVLAVFISLGLTLAPVQAARLMPLTPVSLVQTSVHGAPSKNKTCTCCKFAGQCTMAMCAVSCPQLGQSPMEPSDFAVVGHAPFVSFAPPPLHSIGWRPPLPPPRA